jgi:hypothetical protein
VENRAFDMLGGFQAIHKQVQEMQPPGEQGAGHNSSCSFPVVPYLSNKERDHSFMPDCRALACSLDLAVALFLPVTHASCQEASLFSTISQPFWACMSLVSSALDL